MSHPTDTHVGKRIRHQRWLAGLTQQQLADACGIKFQQIQKYETGANRVAASRLKEIADALNVSIAFFFEGLDAETPTLEPESQVEAALIRLFRQIPSSGARQNVLRLARDLTGATT